MSTKHPTSAAGDGGSRVRLAIPGDPPGGLTGCETRYNRFGCWAHAMVQAERRNSSISDRRALCRPSSGITSAHTCSALLRRHLRSAVYGHPRPGLGRCRGALESGRPLGGGADCHGHRVIYHTFLVSHAGCFVRFVDPRGNLCIISVHALSMPAGQAPKLIH